MLFRSHAGHELYVNWDIKKAEFIADRDNLLGQIIEDEFPELLGPGLKRFGITYPVRKW